MGKLQVNGDISATGTISASSFLGNASSATTSRFLSCHDTRNYIIYPNNMSASEGIQFDFKAASTIGLSDADYSGVMSYRPYSSSSDWTGGSAHQLAFNTAGLYWRQSSGNSWLSWQKIIHSGNYTSYTVTKTGSGASGTWGISISGNAATATTATNADKLDGYHSSDFMGYTSLWIDASSLDVNTYYPVTIPIAYSNGLSRIKLAVQLNSGTVPSWSTHSNGFTSNIDVEIISSGWGTVSYNRYIKYQDDYNFATVKPAYFAGQLYTASQAVFYVRGGGKYHFIMHWQNAQATLHTASVSLNDDTVAPTTSTSLFHSGVYTSIDTNITGGAKYLFDSSNSTATYLNYGASGITSTPWMAAWNGYELRAMSPDYVCASRLYSTDSSYKFSSSAPYYGYLTYSAPYWDFKVYPATPADVRVSRAYTAGTADNANWASGATYAQSVYGTYTGNGGNQVPSYIGANRTKFNMMRNFGSADIGGYMDCILMNNYSWSDVPYATGLGITKVNGYPRAIIANGPQGSWAYATELLTSYNYSWWAVPISGGTMTGNLAINTQGNTMIIGSLNNGWCHFQSSADIPFYFNRRVFVDGCLGIYRMNAQGCGSSFPSSPTTGQIFFKI